MRVCLFLLSLMISGPSLADGMPVVDGRFRGAVTVIELNPAQVAELAAQQERAKIWAEAPGTVDVFNHIELDSRQRKALKADTGKDPKRFLFYDSRVGDNDCTCHAANRALRFSETAAEIPHEYLMSDEEAKRLADEFE